MTFRKAAAWEDTFFGPIEEAMTERAVAEMREEDYESEVPDLNGASSSWLPLSISARCLRCGRTWHPRSASPKQCRWCKSRAWRSAPGSIPLGRPRSQPRLKAMKKA